MLFKFIFKKADTSKNAKIIFKAFFPAFIGEPSRQAKSKKNRLVVASASIFALYSNRKLSQRQPFFVIFGRSQGYVLQGDLHSSAVF